MVLEMFIEHLKKGEDIYKDRNFQYSEEKYTKIVMEGDLI